MDLPPLRILTGQTVHARYTPFEQRFSYRLLMIDIDVDRLAEAGGLSGAFSTKGPALFGLRARDYGPRTGGNLRPWAEEQLERAGVDASGCGLRLVTFPRHAFYKFAPLSIWFATDPAGNLKGAIYDVNNTFGETHSYVAAADGNRQVSEAEKRFHVSPFFDVTGRYRFTMRSERDRLGLVIDTLVDGQRTHMATIKARYSPATTGNFIRAALGSPLSSVGVTAGIHWEALKLWLRGAGYRSKPAPPESSFTQAFPRPEKDTYRS